MEHAMEKPVPTWKFWHPLSFWHVIGILFVLQVVFNFVLVVLREGLGIDLPQGVAGGLAGGLGWVIIVLLAHRRRQSPPPDAS